MGGGARPSGDSASTDLAPSANEPSRFVVRPLQEKVGVSAKGTARRPGGRVHPFIGDGSEVHLKGPVQVRSNPHRAEGFGRANVALKPVRNGGLKGEEDQTMDASSDGSVREENLSQRSASADLVSGSDVSKALQNSPSDRISSGTSLAGNSGAGGLAAPGFVSPSAPLDLPADNDKSQTEEDLSGVRVGDGSEEQTRGEEPGKLSLLENASEMQVDQGEEMRSSFEFDAPARHGVGPEGEGSFRQPGEASKDSTGGPTTPGAESIRGHLDPALPMAVSEELSEESRRSDSDGSIREGAPLLEETGLDVGKGGRAGDGGSERSTDFEEGARPLSEVARSYQLEVLAQARKENTIAFLETGSGKTLIAVMLIKEKAEEFKQQGKKKLSVFLVPKIPLVYQQSDVVRVNTGLKVGHYCGEMGVDFWDHATWVKEFEENEVLVMTAQIFLNILRHSFLKMSAVGLLIMDECHHAVKKHPYSLIMDEAYHPAPPDQRPAIFGMTASPVNLKGVSSQEDCAYKLRSLEVKLDARVCTIQDRGVLDQFVPTPHERIVEYDPPLVKYSIRAEVEALMQEVEKASPTGGKKRKWVAVPTAPPEENTENAAAERGNGPEEKGGVENMEVDGTREVGVSESVSGEGSTEDPGNRGENESAKSGEGRMLYWKKREEGGKSTTLLQKLGSILYVLDELGQWFAYKVAKRYLKKVSELEPLPGSALPGDPEQREVQLAYLRSVVKLLRCTLQEGPAPREESGASPEEAQHRPGGDHSDPILGGAVKDGLVSPKVQALVRTLLGYEGDAEDFRCIVFVERIATAKVLPSLMLELPSLRFLVCCALIGHANQHMKSRDQQEVIDNFRAGHVTLLIATSVAEEGLDIQACHSVIRFDLAKTVCGYIQSRGRARRPGSDYVLMVERNNAEHAEYVAGARSSEEKMQREAIQRSEMTIEVPAPAPDVATYTVPLTGALVSMNSAVQLINYYCSKLPHDKYTELQPEYRVQENVVPGGGVTYTCELHLPCNAPLQIVKGPEKESMHEAQQAACLEACKQLHENGALTDMLLPDLGTPEIEGPVNGDVELPVEGPVKRRAYREKPAGVLGGRWVLEKRKKGEKTVMQLYAVEIVKRRKEGAKTRGEGDVEGGSEQAAKEGGATVSGRMDAEEMEEDAVPGDGGNELETGEKSEEDRELEDAEGEEDEGLEAGESVTSFGFVLERQMEEDVLALETELFFKKDVVTSARVLYCGEVHLAQADVKFLREFHIRLLSTVLELSLPPSEADWDPAKLYCLVPMVKKTGQLGLSRNRPWDINWEVIKTVSRDPAWVTLVPEKPEASKVTQQVWVAKSSEGGDVTPRPMTSSSGGSDSTAGGSREEFFSRPESPGDWAPIGAYNSFRGYDNFGGGEGKGKPRRTRSPMGGRGQGSGRGGLNLVRTNSVPARFQGSPPPGMTRGAHSPHPRTQTGTPPLSPSGGLNAQVFPPPHLGMPGPAAQYPIPLLQQNMDPGMGQHMAMQQMMAANNAALAALMTQQQALMGAVAAQQQLAVATDPAAKQHAVNSLLHAQSQVVASANAAANAAVIQTQNALNQPHFTPPILIPHNPFPGHQSPRSGASSPAPGVDFGPHHYPPSPLPFVNPGYFNPGVTPMQTSSPVHSPMHQRGGPKSASAFYQQRGGYASQNAGPPPLKRQGSGLVSAAEVIEQIASGGQPTPEQQAAMEGGVMHAPSRGGRRSPASTRQRGQLLNIGAQAFEPRPDSGESGGSRDGSVHGSKDGPGRGPLPRSGSVRAMTSYERSSSDEGQKEERGPKGLKKSGRALKRSSSQSSMKRWDGALVLADGPVDPDALRGRVVIATHSGKRFFVDKIEVELDADSPFPQKDNATSPPEYATFTEYYWKRYGLKLLHRKQPLLRCSGVRRARNHLVLRFDSTAETGAESSRPDFFVQLPAELCQLHPIGSAVLRTGLHMPSVMRRIESLLVAAQLRAAIGLPIGLEKVLQALTSSACQEAFSYERAELLGDGFLKYAVSRRLFLLHPLRHEGQLTGLRQQVVSNSALFQLALAKGLEGLVQADLFNPSKWAAPGLPRTGLVERETVEEGGSGEASGRGGGGGESQGGGTVKGAQPGGRGTSVRPMGSVEEDTGGVRGATPSEVLGRRLDEIRTADGERGAGRATSDGVRTGEEDGADVRHLAESDFPPLGEESSPRTPQQETPPIQGVRALSIGTSSEGSPATGFLRGGDKLGRLVIERAAASPASVLAFEEPANEEAPRGTGRDPPGTRPDNGAVNAWRSEKNDSVHSNPKEVRSQPHSRPAPRGALEVPASANPDPVSAKPRVVNSDGRPEEEVSEAGFGPTDWRVVSDKGLADVVEALIGTYHAEGGVPAAVGLMEWVGIETQFPASAVEQARRGAAVPEAVLRSSDCAAVEAILGYSFRSRALLVEALTHPTGAEQSVPCYQRLEFLGDAVLDYLITRHLYDAFPDLSPGMLTDLRSAAVNNENFARVAVTRGLHRHLRHRSAVLMQQVTAYAIELEAAGTDHAHSFGLVDHSAPKVLGDVFESLAGAVLLDCGLDHETVWRVFEPLLQPIVTPDTLPIHPVRELQEACQRLDEGLEYRQNRVGRLAQVDVFLNGEMVGSAQNAQKKMAQKHAARDALAHLRQQYGDQLTAVKTSPTGQAAGSQPLRPENRQNLNELCAKRGWPMPDYFTVSESDAATDVRFTYGVKVRMLGKGEGATVSELVAHGEAMPSIKKAKDSAAIRLLRKLEGISKPSEAR